MPDLIATALPGYEIGAELGRGGFGAVLAARHRLMGRAVAIKVLLDPEAAGAGSGSGGGPAGGPSGPGGGVFGSGGDESSDLRTRFLSEARVLAGLDHTHIVRVYDYVEHSGLCLLVMEQLTGGSLRQRMAAGGLDPRAGCAVGLAAATALAAAHQIGVLHRDIKPDNLLFDASGVPKVTDFGIAKIVETTAVTTTGLVGTPRYMAPEQIEGSRLGPGTDIYALGIVLYELLAGRPIFPRGLTVPALLHHHLSVPPQPLPEVPAPLAAVVLAALAKHPAERPASAHELALHLAAAATAVFGPGWLTTTGVPVRLPDDVLTAAGHRLGDTLPAPFTPSGAWTTPAHHLAQPTIITPPGSTPLGTPPPTPTTPAQPGQPLPAGQAGPAGWQPYAANGTPPPGFGGPAGFPPHPEPASPSLAPTRRRRRARPSARRRTAFIAMGVGVVCVAALVVGLVLATRGGPGGAKAGYAGEQRVLTGGGYLGAIGLAENGSVFVAASGASDGTAAVYQLDPDGNLRKIAGVGPAAPRPSGTPATETSSPSPTPSPAPIPASGISALSLVLQDPRAVAVAPDGVVYIADYGASQVYRVTPGGQAFVFAGVSADEDGFTVDSGLATKAALYGPTALAIGPDGSVYLAEGNRIRKVTKDGLISTVAGAASRSGAGNREGDGGPATKATLPSPNGLVVADDGTIYVSDDSLETVRKITPAGVISTVAGIAGTSGDTGDGGPAAKALLYDPSGLALGGDGSLYIADQSNGRIRRVGVDGVITTYAGVGSSGSGGLDGTLATQADLGSVGSIIVDPSGAVYASLYYESTLVRIDSTDHIVRALVVPPAT
ncbi:serine/threonine-protein kinase [Pseudofrankia saprophytica]|uniref:serine/threonine-protein kinase n=1 Tax=Pseudofrankia saprophytica TaxID=298655 RepID=UPI001E286808|nr:serine/threonine-protein kinase [Pseudofrankia saprophytica]